MEVKKIDSLSREDLIERLEKLMPIENNKITWYDLCYFTNFDSFVTALAFGMNWEEDINKAEMGQLRMALFNMINYPAEHKKEKECPRTLFLQKYRETQK
jgi:hypothetical protein